MWENEKQIFVTHGLLKQDFTKENTILKRISVFWSKLHFQRQLRNKAGQLASSKITQIEETSQIYTSSAKLLFRKTLTQLLKLDSTLFRSY